MRLPQICIDRPVLSTVLSLVVVVFGALSLARLPNSELPDIEIPVVTIQTTPADLLGTIPREGTPSPEESHTGVNGMNRQHGEDR